MDPLEIFDIETDPEFAAAMLDAVAQDIQARQEGAEDD